jgi:predicted ferric reductase
MVGSGHTMFNSVGDFFTVLGRLCGLLAVYFVLLQFLMMGRTRWIEGIFGLDKITRIHRLNGYLSITFIILHPIFIVIGYSFLGKIGLWAQIIDLLTNYEDTLEALIAVILFITIVFFSIYIVRKRLKYEYWYWIHLMTYLAIIFAWGHQLKLGGDFVSNTLFSSYWYALYIFVFGNFAIFRFITPVYKIMRFGFYVSDIKAETHDVNSIYISGNHLENYKVNPGQFVMVRFLAWPHLLESHPFSISQIPQKGVMRLSVKAVGDFTKTINNIKKGTKVYIDGPYGIFTKKVLTRDKVLCIAGGIGITPLRVLSEELAKEGKDLQFIYINRNEKDIAFKKEMDMLSKTYHFPIHYVLTQEKKQGYQSGRLNEELIAKLVKDFKQRDIYLCASWPMMQSTIKQLEQMGVQHSQIHYERFSL